MSEKSSKVFLREATGLVREMGILEAAAINWTGETVYTGLITFLAFSYLFPGGNLLLAIILSVFLFVPLSLSYAMSTAAMPRAGGDYVFISRTLHPALGLMLVFSLNVWFAFYSGAFANWIFTIGLAPTFSVVGNVLNSQSLLHLASVLSEPLVVTLGGAVFIVITAMSAIFSAKMTARLTALFILIGFASLVVIAGLFLANSPSTFRTAFNTYSSSFTNNPDYYSAIVNEAQSAGLRNAGWFNTLGMLPFGAYIFLYVSEMQALGGEIKNPRRTAYYAAYVTLLVGGIFSALTVFAYMHALPQGFYNAVTYDYYNGLKYALPVAPTYNFLASLLTKNVFLLWAANIGLVTTSIALLLMYFMFTPRYFLAASFDRVLPDKLGSVSERFHTPYVSILVAMVLALITLPVYTYYASLLATLSAVLGELLFGYLVFSIAAMLFPLSPKTRAIYKTSVINKSVGGVPLITILGALSTAILAIFGYMMLVNPTYGVNSTVSLISVVVVAAAAPIWYFARRLQFKKRGINIDSIYSEIPPE